MAYSKSELGSLSSVEEQNFQNEDFPKSQHSVSSIAKALTSNNHAETKKDKSKQARIEDVSSSTSAGVKTQLVVAPQKLPVVANKMTMCKPSTANKWTSCRPQQSSIQCQTDDELGRRIMLPIPVPIYIPQPMYMYSAPFPVPVPIPLPIPVPILIPTTQNSAEGIMKEIKRIRDNIPTDPREAELLMIAEMLAGDKNKNESDSDSEPDAIKYKGEYHPPAETLKPSQSFGEDDLQMDLKMEIECGEPAVDLESAITTNTITSPATVQHMSQEHEESIIQMIMIDGQWQVICGTERPSSSGLNSPVPEASGSSTVPVTQGIDQSDHVTRESVEEPGANFYLGYNFGVRTWEEWVMTKNAEIEKSPVKRKPFKSDLLQLTAEELNYYLSLFVKEIRKPNGREYPPDMIYYLVLGIQQYLFENGRGDNIFTDPYYEHFTDCLDEVAKKMPVLYNNSDYLVTHVGEEDLWDCNQLGAHSPLVLLNTLMFFNTKYFNLVTVEEHMQLCFSHIMGSLTGTKLRRLEAKSNEQKVYEQEENEANPLRCPVNLYKFYLSKCPGSIKTCYNVSFYLQPERSCIPDSPLWYSTEPLSKETLSKMLHRIQMVKEINVALLSSL